MESNPSDSQGISKPSLPQAWILATKGGMAHFSSKPLKSFRCHPHPHPLSHLTSGLAVAATKSPSLNSQAVHYCHVAV